MLLLTACGKSVAEQIQEQLDLGYKYLEELDYEQAIVAFTKAIELNENYTEGYLGLANVYVQCREYEKAIEILQQGYKMTQNKKITE